MMVAASGPAPIGALALFVALVVAQRLIELGISARNARRVLARGAVEHGRAHFPLLVLVHMLFPLFLVAEVIWFGARPWPSWWFWLALWLGAQALRVAAIRALGDRWNVRILVVPGESLVRLGPYRLLRHPNYLAVVVELIAAPFMFGAWRTTIVITALNAFALWIRITAEERALGAAARESDVETAAARALAVEPRSGT
ncbi:MAG TPA: isoprenylcysteine carboxylmethyltransferase family protein [Candidatus Limnocylindria bacterium]|nr:isoprenylcysteine carboxylmethyltransferase family protein [Candidatus Limnocylindria bacterium]